MIKVHELANDVDVSSEELIEILHDIEIEVDGAEAELSDEQVAQVCDELGYASVEEAREQTQKDHEAVAANEEVEAPGEEAPAVEDVEMAEESAVTEAVAEAEPEPSIIYLKKVKISVKDLAEKLGMKSNKVIAELMGMNIFASINQEVDLKVAKAIGEKHGFTIEKEEKKKPVAAAPKTKIKIEKDENAPENADQLLSRPPVVTFMGHVDHGKTSLLDRIRHTRVVTGESGGITQHIGAYTVEINDHKITFLDTPGHAAFTAMRARGANLTDIVVLVVAADDGVMPQTIEAIQHAKAAGVTLIVAMNKMDLRSANPDRLKQQLQEHDLMVEDWGGGVGCCPVSAQTGEGMDALLERILLEAEMLELKANPNKPAQGYVIEAQMEPGMGPTASLLVQSGTLKLNDSIICGQYWGRVKALISDQGVKVRSAGPSMAVKCLGLTNVPGAGDEFQSYANDRDAKAIAATMQVEQRQMDLTGTTAKKMSLDDLFNSAVSEDKKQLAVIVKADVQGSVEAIEHSLKQIKSDKVDLNLMLMDVGNVTTNDVMLASASNAIILGFHTGKENGVTAAAKSEGVEIRLYSVIYELIDEVESAMKGLLEPELREQIIGQAAIQQVFELSKRSKIAGCMVSSGKITARASIRIKRDREILYEGTIGSLKRFQNEASEVREGQECGIRPNNFTNFDAGDLIEAYLVEKITQEL
ncbi:MAG: translation initiation factor IF-2 [Kiritimatiellales bacterium]|nr:translation initiation factor IF-2 [Kiritimatiellales bacterium]